MALMWPRALPEWVIQDPRRAAEREVYSRLDRALDDGWTVYYSRPWWGLNKSGGEVDGECDFIVVHPQKGVLFIEVKGGLVGYDALTSKWSSRDRQGIKYKIKDPIGQAMSSKHQLLKKFEKVDSWPKRRVRLRHGAILPDSEPTASGSIGSHEQELFCFATMLRDNLLSWVEKRLASHAAPGLDNESGPGSEGLAAIEATVASPVQLKVPLHRQVEGDIAKQDLLLTGAQLQVIAFVDAFPRIVVEGGAGTGKTVVAGELAVRYAEANRTVLLCCLSEALAASLALRIGHMPKLEIKAMSELRSLREDISKQYEAVIVDEGQDVEWKDWDIIEKRLSQDGLLRVFYDGNQAVYRARDDLETRLQAKGIALSLNLRNTRRIAAVTEPLYRGPLVRCEGSEGTLPLLVETRAGMSDPVVRAIRGLVVEHAIAPSDVAVLVGDDDAASDVKARLRASGLLVSDALGRARGSIVVETIARFKGLEALAVVVQADRISANNQELSYVGVSRARAILFVIGPVGGTLLAKAMVAGGCEELASRPS